jgi:hypothetical protein
MKKQVINTVLISDYSYSYTNKKDEKVTQTSVAFAGEVTKQIKEVFNTLKAAGKARFQYYLSPDNFAGAKAEATKLSYTFVSPKDNKEKGPFVKGWLVDPEHATAVITDVKGIDVAIFEAEKAEKEAKRAVKAADKAESSPARKVTTVPSDKPGMAMIKVEAALAKYKNKAGIPAKTISALNSLAEASGLKLADLFALAAL